MILDASPIVAVLKLEPTTPAVEAAIKAATSPLLISAVTVTEIILAALKIGMSATQTRVRLEMLGVEIVSVDEAQAITSAEARHRYPISFGDGFVYALAKTRNLPILTLDAEFSRTDAEIVPLA